MKFGIGRMHVSCGIAPYLGVIHLVVEGLMGMSMAPQSYIGMLQQWLQSIRIRKIQHTIAVIVVLGSNRLKAWRMVGHHYCGIGMVL